MRYLVIWIILLIALRFVNRIFNVQWLEDYGKGLCFIITSIVSGVMFDGLGLKDMFIRIRIKDLIYFLIGALIVFLNYEVLNLYFSKSIKSNIISGNAVYYSYRAMFFGWLILGISEEILFRGYLFGVFHKITNNKNAIIIASFLFSIMHIINPEYNLIIDFLYAFAIGIGLSIMCIKTKSIWFAVGYHAVFNYSVDILEENMLLLFNSTVIVTLLIACLLVCKLKQSESVRT